MKLLVLAVGDYGVGKTAFAKWYAKENKGMYLDSELLHSNGDFETYLKKLTATVEKNSNKLFVTEEQNIIFIKPKGHPVSTSIYLKDNIKCDVQVCLCFAAPHIVRARQLIKAPHVADPLPLSEETVKLSTYSRFNTIVANETNPLFVDTTSGFQFIAKEDFAQRWEELIFYSNLDKMPHDKYYEDIELPSGLTILGYTQGYKSWRRLQHLINFKNKSVLDIGCFHGYFSFKAEEAGARSVIGIDICKSATEVASQIAILKNSKAYFYCSSLADFKPNCTYDIVLALNVLHHIKDINQALEDIFRIGKLIVFETPTSQRDSILHCAKQYGFGLTDRANSHRIGREILVFANPQVSTITTYRLPVRYRYNYRFAYLKKLPRGIATKLVWRLEPYYPFAWLMHKYRSRREARTKRVTYQ